MPETHRQLGTNDIFYARRQTLRVPDFPCPLGWILDVGGGGEGIIGIVKGQQVVAIDTLRSELAAVANDSLKIVMDARRMGFLDETFVAATAFFSLLYITGADQAVVMREVWRVLRPDADFWVWDAAIPDLAAERKSLFALPLAIELPGGRVIETGYATPPKAQGLESLAGLAAGAGFEIVHAYSDGPIVEMRLRKPRAREGCRKPAVE